MAPKRPRTGVVRQSVTPLAPRALLQPANTPHPANGAQRQPTSSAAGRANPLLGQSKPVPARPPSPPSWSASLWLSRAKFDEGTELPSSKGLSKPVRRLSGPKVRETNRKTQEGFNRCRHNPIQNARERVRQRHPLNSFRDLVGSIVEQVN